MTMVVEVRKTGMGTGGRGVAGAARGTGAQALPTMIGTGRFTTQAQRLPLDRGSAGGAAAPRQAEQSPLHVSISPSRHPSLGAAVEAASKEEEKAGLPSSSITTTMETTAARATRAVGAHRSARIRSLPRTGGRA